MKKDELVLKILEKKELQGIPSFFAEDKLSALLSKRKLNLSVLSYKEESLLIKEIRAMLRDYVGRFSNSIKKRELLISQGKYSELLKTHSSTKERIGIYPWLKEKILSIKPNSILDLACGINPIALADKTIFYYAYDLNKQDLKAVEEYFKRENLNGEVSECDLTTTSSLPAADLTLIFKTLDILEKKHKGISEKIITLINSKNIIVSFSISTLSGKPMNFPRREWFEKILNKHHLHFIIEKKQNEIFYFIEKIVNPKQNA